MLVKGTFSYPNYSRGELEVPTSSPIIVEMSESYPLDPNDSRGELKGTFLVPS